MWRPGFPYIERQAATLYGRRRAFCLYAVHHRGTPERPGLTLGLLPRGSVRGVAFRVPNEQWPNTYAYLRERELPTEAYFEATMAVRLADGRKVKSLVFLPDVTHSQWAGELPLECQCDLIANAIGVSGRNHDYLRDLVEHLRTENIRDRRIEELMAMVDAHRANSSCMPN